MGFTIMHDASHFGVSIHSNINYWLNKLLQGWGLWNANIWFYHHVLNHHSFTGEDKLDPDFIIYNHLRIKMELENPKNYII